MHLLAEGREPSGPSTLTPSGVLMLAEGREPSGPSTTLTPSGVLMLAEGREPSGPSTDTRWCVSVSGRARALRSVNFDTEQSALDTGGTPTQSH